MRIQPGCGGTLTRVHESLRCRWSRVTHPDQSEAPSRRSWLRPGAGDASWERFEPDDSLRGTAPSPSLELGVTAGAEQPRRLDSPERSEQAIHEYNIGWTEAVMQARRARCVSVGLQLRDRERQLAAVEAALAAAKSPARAWIRFGRRCPRVQRLQARLDALGPAGIGQQSLIGEREFCAWLRNIIEPAVVLPEARWRAATQGARRQCVELVNVLVMQDALPAPSLAEQVLLPLRGQGRSLGHFREAERRLAAYLSAETGRVGRPGGGPGGPRSPVGPERACEILLDEYVRPPSAPVGRCRPH